MQDDSTGSVHSMLMEAPTDTNYARRMAIKAMLPGHTLVAMVKGMHPIIPGIPTSA